MSALFEETTMEPIHTTELATLYHRDCLELLLTLANDAIDTIFSDLSPNQTVREAC